MEHARVREAHDILLYYSLPDEVDTHRLIELLHAEGKNILLPHVVSDTDMVLCRYAGPESLVSGAYGILEPSMAQQVDIDEVAHYDRLTCIVPGVAFDTANARLGRGRGYYDRMLCMLKERVRDVYLIGIAFDFQIVSNIPCDHHDIRMDEVINPPVHSLL